MAKYVYNTTVRKTFPAALNYAGDSFKATIGGRRVTV